MRLTSSFLQQFSLNTLQKTSPNLRHYERRNGVMMSWQPLYQQGCYFMPSEKLEEDKETHLISFQITKTNSIYCSRTGERRETAYEGRNEGVMKGINKSF